LMRAGLKLPGDCGVRLYHNFLDRQSIQRDLAGQITLCNGKTSFKPNLKTNISKKACPFRANNVRLQTKGREREITRLSFPEIVSELAHKSIHPERKNKKSKLRMD